MSKYKKNYVTRTSLFYASEESNFLFCTGFLWPEVCRVVLDFFIQDSTCFFSGKDISGGPSTVMRIMSSRVSAFNLVLSDVF